MQVTVFGASGKVGQQVVSLALAEGYDVRAFVHRHNPFEEHAKLSIATGDINDSTAVSRALQGSQAVISALGSWGTKDKNILRVGMQTILPAMQEQGIKRIITVTGSGARWSRDKPGLITAASRLLLKLVAPRILRDGEAHIQLLEASQLDWTCLRSPVMRGSSNGYKLSPQAPSLFATVPRQQVSRCLVDMLESSEHSQDAPFIQKA